MLGWSPEQIAHRIKLDFPDDDSMRISHEAIYQALFIESRGALKRELILCLRTGRALRMSRARSKRVPWAHVTADVLISERPPEAEDRAIPGHHEGDLIIGINRSAIGTVVERTTGFTTLVHLPREDGWREQPIVKNGPALSGYGALSMNRALAAAMSTMPAELKRSLTWDRGKEMSAHAQFAIDTGLTVYFADPHSPWQRGTNENTNGLLRQYFPKGTDLSRWTPDDLAAVAHALNTRPRKRLGWRPPLRHSTSTYTCCKQAVLRRPVESATYTANAFTRLCAQQGIRQSMGRVGSCFDCEHRDCATTWGLTLAYDRPCGCPRVDVSAPGGGVHQAAGRVGSDLIGA